MKKFRFAGGMWLLVILWSQCTYLALGQVKPIDAQATRLGILQKSLIDLTSGRVKQSPGSVHENALAYTKGFRTFVGENKKLFGQIEKKKLTETLVAWLSDPLLHKRQIALLLTARLPKDKRVEIVKLAKSRIAELKSSTTKLERQNGSLIVREYQKRQLYLQYKAADKEYFWNETSQKKILESLLVDK